MCVTVSANGLPMLRDVFHLSKHSSKSVPVGIFGSKNVQVDYEVRIDHLSCLANPIVVQKVVTIVGLPADFTPLKSVRSEPIKEAHVIGASADTITIAPQSSVVYHVIKDAMKKTVSEATSVGVLQKNSLAVSRGKANRRKANSPLSKRIGG